MIPMVDLNIQYQQLQEKIEHGIRTVLESCQFILGPTVAAFEKEAAEYLGAAHAVTVASGTDALHLALVAAGIGPGNEVITTPFTFIATAEAISYVGAKPVFVDIDPRTFNIDPTRIEAAITPDTRAILPVHLFGQPSDMEQIAAICDRFGFLLIEDCAQSFGADIGGKMTGTLGTMGCFSFFPSKNLGCYGDGGMITTDSDDLADKLRMLRNHGSKKRYHHDVIGFNSRLDEIQAAVLKVKLACIEEFTAGRRRVARLYDELLLGTGIITPFQDGKGIHVFHQYTVLTDHRDAIMSSLAEDGIASAIYYPIPLHRQDVFINECRSISLPVAETVASRCLSLPIFPEMTEEQVVAVVKALKKALPDNQ